MPTIIYGIKYRIDPDRITPGIGAFCFLYASVLVSPTVPDIVSARACGLSISRHKQIKTSDRALCSCRRARDSYGITSERYVEYRRDEQLRATASDTASFELRGDGPKSQFTATARTVRRATTERNNEIQFTRASYPLPACEAPETNTSIPSFARPPTSRTMWVVTERRFRRNR